MIPALNLPPISVEHIDQRVRLHGIDWEGYESFLALRGEQSGTRVTYLDGELELMSPSINHEIFKKTLARLLEAYAEEKGIELNGYGSWTVKSAKDKLGVEADECYVVGLRDAEPTIPDIAIEVVWTSGGIDKLEVYRGLGVPEVWFWQKGALRFFLLREDGYLASARSRLLPDLDPALIARCMGESSQTQAVRALRAALRDAGIRN
ncbi:MAG: Uma2 family endonuclease [Candidatus Contendobacter sp.]|nr:MAG: Uma2 family endonuclease [Candidatus Contendobacter sp.]